MTARTEKNRNPKILIVRTDNIGDVILSVPAAKAVKNKYPDAEVVLLCKNITRIIGERYSYIDSTISIEKDNGEAKTFFKLVKEVRSHSFDAAIVLRPTMSNALAVYFAGISKRAGTGYRFYSFLFNKKRFEHRKVSQKHEAEYNMGIAEEAGFSPVEPELNFHIKDSEIREAEEALNKSGINKSEKYCVIHPGSRGSAMDWSAEYFGRTADLFKEKLNLNVFVTYGPGEENIAENVAANANNKISLLDEVYPLPVIAGILKNAELVLAPSTGVLHLANSVGAKVIGLYPPVPQMSPKRWGPYGYPERTIIPDINKCENCKEDRICKQIDCMKLITPEMVIRKAEEIISNSGETQS